MQQQERLTRKWWQRVKPQRPWYHHECYECPGAWEIRWPIRVLPKTYRKPGPLDLNLLPFIQGSPPSFLKYLGGGGGLGSSPLLRWVEDDIWSRTGPRLHPDYYYPTEP